MRRVTGGFDARKMCDRRRYEYVAPAFVFDPTACRERQWYYDEENAKRRAAADVAAAAAGAQASEAAAGPSGGDTAAAAPLQSPEAAAPRGLGAAAADDAAEPADAVLTEAAEMPADGASAGPVPAAPTEDGAMNGSHPQPGTDAGDVLHPAPGSSADMGSPDFKFDQACVERLSGILSQYEGTHCFHNYTVKVAATSPEARRYIVRFRCEGTFEMEVRRRTEAPASSSPLRRTSAPEATRRAEAHSSVVTGTPPPCFPAVAADAEQRTM